MITILAPRVQHALGPAVRRISHDASELTLNSTRRVSGNYLWATAPAADPLWKSMGKPRISQNMENLLFGLIFGSPDALVAVFGIYAKNPAERWGREPLGCHLSTFPGIFRCDVSNQEVTQGILTMPESV